MGSTLRINGEAFELIGIFDEKSRRQYVNTNRPDNQLLVVPTTVADARLGFEEDQISVLMGYPRAGVEAERVFKVVVASLGKRRGFHAEDTDAGRHFDMTQTTRLLDLMHAAFTLFIGLAGTVTLLVGGVGLGACAGLTHLAPAEMFPVPIVSGSAVVITFVALVG